MKSTPRERSLTILVWLGIAAALGWLLGSQFQHLRYEHRVRTCLVELQHGLQAYIESRESYPRISETGGAGLTAFLLAADCLESPPLNPATGTPYTGEEDDDGLIIYTTDPPFKHFTLKALDRDRGSVMLSIDSAAGGVPISR